MGTADPSADATKANLLLPPQLVGPSSFYFRGQDNLRLQVWNGFPGAEVTCEGRFLSRTGEIVPFAERMVPTSDRLVNSATYIVGEGWLLNVQVRASVGAVRAGLCFAMCEVVRGAGAGLQPLACLLQGYVTDVQRLAWPNTLLRPSIEGQGLLRSLAGATPAAGAEIAETVPVGVRWHLLALKVQLATSATVANRIPRLILDDTVNAFFVAEPNAALVASSTYQVQWAAGISGSTIGSSNGVYLPLPSPLLLSQSWRIRTLTSGIQAGDQYGSVAYLVREWIIG
jgi:hypothetical protein